MSNPRISLIFLILIFAPLLISPKFIDKNDKAEDTIYIKSSINEVFASTEVLQYFKNILDDTIELSVSFPIKEEISLSKFEITIGDRKVSSIIMEKEKAHEKYEETISQGNIGFISEYTEESGYYMFKIGNIKPGEFVQLQAFFYQKITSQDMSYEFNIMEKYPTFHYNHINQEKFRNKKIIAIFKIQTQSKITRLIAPFFDEKAKKNSGLEIEFNQDYTKAIVFYVKKPDEQTNIDTIGRGSGGLMNKPTFYSSFCLLFRTANMNKPTLFYQYNPELKEISYAINYVYSSKKMENIPIPPKPDLDNTIIYSVKYEENLNFKTPGLFIILVDQSGSMDGKSIELVKKSLLSFLNILPKGSYFHLIGFGTHFQNYSEKPLEINTENIEIYKKIITEMKANLGGTNIGKPLKYIFGNEDYDDIKLSKNIFLLTDGQVRNRDECIDLITKNSNRFRLHAIGIGNNFDKVLIKRSGKVGKGSSFFVNDVEDIEMVMLNILIKCLRPYLIDINFKFNNYEQNLKNKIISSTVTNDFSYQDEIINFSFILDEKNEIFFDESINMEITAKDPINLIKEKVSFNFNENVIKLNDGDEMAKMIVGNALKNNLEFIENEKKEIEFSTKYQILSKNTAIFTEILNKNGKKFIKIDKIDPMTKVDLNQYKDKIYCNKKKTKKQKVNKVSDIFSSSFSFSSPNQGGFDFNNFKIENNSNFDEFFKMAELGRLAKNNLTNNASQKQKQKNKGIIKNSGNKLYTSLNILLYYLLLLISLF